MLRSAQWIAAISIVVLFVSLAVISYCSSPPSGQPREQQTSTHAEAENQNEKQHSLRGFIRFMFPDALSIFTFWLTLATVGLGVVAVFQIGFLKRAETIASRGAKAAQDAADVASKTLLATQRPWINSEIKIASDFIFGETEARVTFAYTLKNIGNAVATNIQVNPKLIPLQFGKVTGEPPNIKIEIPQTQPITELKILCEDQTRLLDNPQAAEFVGGHVIFPNDSIPDAVNIHMLNTDINAARARSAYKSLIPVLLFCVAYRSPFDKGTHYTGHAFQLFRRDSKNPGGAREIGPDEGNVPANELMLMRFPFNSSIAD